MDASASSDSSSDGENIFTFQKRSFHEKSQNHVRTSCNSSSGDDDDDSDSSNSLRKRKRHSDKNSSSKRKLFADFEDSQSNTKETQSKLKREHVDPILLQILDSDDDSDVDESAAGLLKNPPEIPRTDRIHMEENSILTRLQQQAKEAKQALARNVCIDEEDDQEEEICVYEPHQPQNQHMTNASQEPYITLVTRIKGGDSRVTHNYKIKVNDPFKKLLNAYRQEHQYSSVKPIFLEYEGILIDPDTTPRQNQLKNNALIEIIDKEQKMIQLEKCGRLLDDREDNGVGNDARSTGENDESQINLQLRMIIPGTQNPTTQSFRFGVDDKFSQLMDLFCEKNGVLRSECQFIFDGIGLDANGTPRDEGLEGDEMIDVKINRKNPPVLGDPKSSHGSVRNPIQTTSCQVPPHLHNTLQPRQAVASTISARHSIQNQSSIAIPPATQMNQNLLPIHVIQLPLQSTALANPVYTSRADKIKIATRRNNDMRSKMRNFQLKASDPISRLKEGYIKTYRSKGCVNVRFYFNGRLIEDETKSIHSVGLNDQDVLIAMENDAPYVCS